MGAETLSWKLTTRTFMVTAVEINFHGSWSKMMEWIATDIASTETDYYDLVTVYMSEEEPTDNTLQSFVELPYNRIEPGVGDITLTETELLSTERIGVHFSVKTFSDLHEQVLIGKTTNKILSGDVTTTFPALVISAFDYNTENFFTNMTVDGIEDIAFGELFFNIKQGSYSRTAIAEVDPLDVGTFLGTIGGFWELMNVDGTEVMLV